MGDKKYQLTKDLEVGLNEPTLEQLDKLVELGFDTEDTGKMQTTWLKTYRDKDKLNELISIIFDDGVVSGHEHKINVKVVYKGLTDFFGLCGVVLI